MVRISEGQLKARLWPQRAITISQPEQRVACNWVLVHSEYLVAGFQTLLLRIAPSEYMGHVTVLADHLHGEPVIEQVGSRRRRQKGVRIIQRIQYRGDLRGPRSANPLSRCSLYPSSRSVPTDAVKFRVVIMLLNVSCHVSQHPLQQVAIGLTVLFSNRSHWRARPTPRIGQPKEPLCILSNVA